MFGLFKSKKKSEKEIEPLYDWSCSYEVCARPADGVIVTRKFSIYRSDKSCNEKWEYLLNSQSETDFVLWAKEYIERRMEEGFWFNDPKGEWSVFYPPNQIVSVELDLKSVTKKLQKDKNLLDREERSG